MASDQLAAEIRIGKLPIDESPYPLPNNYLRCSNTHLRHSYLGRECCGQKIHRTAVQALRALRVNFIELRMKLLDEGGS